MLIKLRQQYLNRIMSAIVSIGKSQRSQQGEEHDDNYIFESEPVIRGRLCRFADLLRRIGKVSRDEIERG